MNNILIHQAKNVDFSGQTHFEGAELPVFTIKEPSVEEWNRKAREANTKMFIRIMGRQPKDYNEVLAWIYTPENEENCQAATIAVL
jgi:hypothetical protein